MLGAVVDVGRDALGAPQIPQIKLSEYGKFVRKEIEEMQNYYAEITICKYVIMPNHVHMIIIIDREDGGAPRASRPTMLIPRIVAITKKKVNKSIGFNLWQDGYYDHIIRTESDYNRICQYIDENPLKWHEDEYFQPT